MIESIINSYVMSHGIKKTSIAKAIGKSQQTLSKSLLGNRKLLIEEYFDICDFLEVPYDKFVKEARESAALAAVEQD